MRVMPVEQTSWLEWEEQLHTMADMGRAHVPQSLKHSLALLALTYLQSKEPASPADASKDPLSTALWLAEQTEQRRGLHAHPLSRGLLAGLSNIPSHILDGWLKIAARNEPAEGFSEWFAAKIDELDLAYQYDTPSSISRLVASLLSGQSPHTIFDPACGTGGLLAAAAMQFGRGKLFGQERSIEAYAWAQLRFMILGLWDAELVLGNSLTDQAFDRLRPDGGFDLILTNPPFGRNIDFGAAVAHAHRPNPLTITSPDRLSSEGTYINETVGSLSSSGFAAVIVPIGFLSRGGADQELRKALVGSDMLQAIVGLPDRLFAPGTTIETAILILSVEKPAVQKQRTLFIDARALGYRDGSRIVLSAESVQQVTRAFQEWEDRDGFSRSVSLDEIASSGFSFSPARYVKSSTNAATMSPSDRRPRVTELQARYLRLCDEYDALRLRLTAFS